MHGMVVQGGQDVRGHRTRSHPLPLPTPFPERDPPASPNGHPSPWSPRAVLSTPRLMLISAMSDGQS